MSGADCPPSSRPGCWLVYAILLGLYLTFRGYHSLDGDQAYRLPLLLHRQDPKLYATDPFVQAIDAFNPHRGCLMVLDLVTRPLGISAGLFLVFALTFAATCFGIDRIAQNLARPRARRRNSRSRPGAGRQGRQHRNQPHL